jgi:hypothetical protein
LQKHNRYSPLFVHAHLFFEMPYVLKGHCMQEVMNHQYDIRAGEFCLIAPTVPHVIGVFDDSIIINIILRSETFKDAFDNLLRFSNRITNFINDSLYLFNKSGIMIMDTEEDAEIRDMVLDM